MSKLAVGDRVRVLVDNADEAPVTAGDQGYVTEVNPLGVDDDTYDVQMVTGGETWFFNERVLELVPVKEAQSTGPHIHADTHTGYDRVAEIAAKYKVRIETTWSDGTRVEVTPDGYTFG